MRGIVAWFQNGRGFGFVTPNGGGKDLFVHFSEIRVNGFKSLTQGQKVEFDVGKDEKTGREVAINVFPLEAPAEGVKHGSRTASNR